MNSVIVMKSCVHLPLLRFIMISFNSKTLSSFRWSHFLKHLWYILSCHDMRCNQSQTSWCRSWKPGFREIKTLIKSMYHCCIAVCVMKGRHTVLNFECESRHRYCYGQSGHKHLVSVLNLLVIATVCVHFNIVHVAFYQIHDNLREYY